ncbi:WAT1-related protein At3g28050-like [Neltuma alba]|uniref:WAT1-related protein At3g28050-like n=1 Tax=Neltuma alba TaxID=207710 RepID=UPI0010A565D8|nr:WAT1-related protein At3g28050-like [Prosopis alba]XP_028783719.1 WAT1-related protein At3g28050-like [Prosopis alba]
MASVAITMAMVAAQFSDVGLNTLVKAATTNGMSKFVFIVYSNALALCFLLPSTFLYHRKVVPPPISRSIIGRIFLSSVLSCAVQTLMYTGIQLSSPTLSSAMLDLVPAFTFILAIVSRMENLDLKFRSSQAKAIGTVVSITGALIVTLYKGLPVTPQPLPEKPLSWVLLSSQHSNWLLGGFLLSIASFCNSLVIVVQFWVLKDYPAEFMVTTICCSFVVVLSAIVALIAEGASEAWILRPDMELVAIFYSAIFQVSIRSVVLAWASRKKGPIYVAMFNPLGMVIAIGMGVIFLRETLYLGSMIGAGIIGIGFYSVMWGLAQEEKMVNEKDKIQKKNMPSSTTPLLQNKSLDV